MQRNMGVLCQEILLYSIVWVQIQKFMLRFREGVLKSAPTDITFLSFNGQREGGLTL